MCITLTAQTSVASNSSHLCVVLCALDLGHASHGMYVYIMSCKTANSTFTGHTSVPRPSAC